MERENYLRVTSLLAPFSGVEFVPEKYLRPAAERGTLVHRYIENKLAGFETPVDNDNITPYLESFDVFWEGSKHIFESGKMTLEKRLYCDDYKITGQVDCIVETDDRIYVMDWKTSSKVQKSWNLQAAAYRYLITKEYKNKHVDDLLFVKLEKSGKKPTLYKYDTYEDDLGMFFNCLDVYNWFNMKGQRRSLEN